MAENVKSTKSVPIELIFWKVTHTVVWVFFVGCIFYVLYSGIANEITMYTWIAIGLVLGESFVLLYNKWVCPITPIARKYSDSPADNFDIYLPNWLAKHNKTIFSIIFSIGLLIVVIRYIAS